MTRINHKYTRLYMSGVDISGYANEVGSLDWLYETSPMAAFADGCMNAIAGKPVVSAGTVNAFLDNDTAGLFALAKSANASRILSVAFGTTAVPVAGQPVFSWAFEQTNYSTAGGAGFVAVTVPMSNSSISAPLTYKSPWGVLLHPSGVETAANTAIGIDDNGGATAYGGVFVYHLLSSNGTVTLTAEDAATNLNASFAAISGATSGSITAAVTPQSGMIALGVTSAVRRFLRPQVAFGTATTCTYMSAFIRNYQP